MNNNQHNSRALNEYFAQEHGFSLLEMVIAATVFLIIMGTIFGLLRAGDQMKQVVNDRSDVVANARAVVDFMGRDVINAGSGYSKSGAVVPDDFLYDLIKIPADGDNLRDIIPAVVAGNDISTSVLSKPGEKNDLIFLTFRDLTFNNGEPVKFLDIHTVSSTPVMKTAPGGCANCKLWDVYLFESPTGKQALGIVTSANADSISLAQNNPLNMNRKIVGNVDTRSILTKCAVGELTNCFDYSPQVTAKRVFLISYSVNNKGTLIQTRYGNNSSGNATQQIDKKELAYGVEKFQVRYLMEDGSLVDDPSNGFTEPFNMNNVIQVEMRITVKSESPTNGKVKVEYINLNSTFSTRNLGYTSE
ncbi:MAG: type II secretion system protein J [Pyrinomonadaceae bacterium]